MKQTIIATSLVATALLALTGCGSSSHDTKQASTGTAFYVDSAVEGVTVTCGSTTSTTDVTGKFTYQDGKDCQFSIGDVALRAVSGITQDQVIIEDIIRTAQFLQSMDYDGDASNGISIHAQTADIMAKNSITAVPSNDQELAEAVVAMENSDIGYQGDFVGEEEARDHVNKTKEETAAQPEAPVTPAPGTPTTPAPGTPTTPAPGTPTTPAPGTPTTPAAPATPAPEVPAAPATPAPEVPAAPTTPAPAAPTTPAPAAPTTPAPAAPATETPAQPATPGTTTPTRP
jgi:hypothetical protein